MNDNEELRREARRRLKARSTFWTFLGVWAVVSIILTVIWLLATPGVYFWPIWAIFGMGVAALFIALDAYGPGRRYHTESDIDAEIERMTRRSGQRPSGRDDPTL